MDIPGQNGRRGPCHSRSHRALPRRYRARHRRRPRAVQTPSSRLCLSGKALEKMGRALSSTRRACGLDCRCCRRCCCCCCEFLRSRAFFFKRKTRERERERDSSASRVLLRVTRCVVMGIMVGGFFVYHLWLLGKGTTTNEHYKRQDLVARRARARLARTKAAHLLFLHLVPKPRSRQV